MSKGVVVLLFGAREEPPKRGLRASDTGLAAKCTKNREVSDAIDQNERHLKNANSRGTAANTNELENYQQCTLSTIKKFLLYELFRFRREAKVTCGTSIRKDSMERHEEKEVRE